MKSGVWRVVCGWSCVKGGVCRVLWRVVCEGWCVEGVVWRVSMRWFGNGLNSW